MPAGRHALVPAGGDGVGGGGGGSNGDIGFVTERNARKSKSIPSRFSQRGDSEGQRASGPAR